MSSVAKTQVSQLRPSCYQLWPNGSALLMGDVVDGLLRCTDHYDEAALGCMRECTPVRIHPPGSGIAGCVLPMGQLKFHVFSSTKDPQNVFVQRDVA